MDIKMEEPDDNLSAEDLKDSDSPHTARSKPKKRSLIERELETNLTARVTSPLNTAECTSTSRYGRARRLKSELEQSDLKKNITDIKSPVLEKSPLKNQSPAYKMHASNSPIKTEPAKQTSVETFLENQIENIYQETISLSRFGAEEVNINTSPAKKFPKVYIRKDLIQKREPDDIVITTKNIFSPGKKAQKSSSTHLNNILERSSEKFSLNSGKQQNGYLDNSSVVKTLDFDCKKKKKEGKDVKVLSKSELFDLEARCPYQVGDLAWARMGTYPFWPSIVTRDPSNGIFVKKKLFGRIERDVIHVTFFGDNGRRGWIVDTMLRKYYGQLEFESTREHFTPEDKKKDPKLYAAFFVSEKKQTLWNNSVEEAEMLLREPKRLRIDIFNDMLVKSRSRGRVQKSGKICRTDSDVSLSESLYDSLFSEDDGKSDKTERSRNRSRNRSLDVFEVVTACLDNMAAKSGITKIQKQSHMDRWLQKAKSKTPEKTQAKIQVTHVKSEEKKVNGAKKKKTPSKNLVKPYSLRKSMTESQNLLPGQNEHNYSKTTEVYSDQNSTDNDCKESSIDCGLGTEAKVENVSNKTRSKKKGNADIVSLDESSDDQCFKEPLTVNGTNESSEMESINNVSQDKNSVAITGTTDTNQTREEENNVVKESSSLCSLSEDTLESLDIGQNESNRDDTISTVYEDSYSENNLESSTNINDSIGMESSYKKSSEVTRGDTTIDSNVATDLTEESVATYDDDSDYRPEYTTESDTQTEDDLSMNESVLSSNSICMTKEETNEISINDSKNNLKDDINSKVVETDLSNVQDDLMDVDTDDRVSQNEGNGHISNDSNNINSNKLADFKDILNSDNVDSKKVPIRRLKSPKHRIVEDITDSTILFNGNVSVKEIDINTVNEVHLCIPESKQNGFHSAIKHMNGDIDLDRISLQSEDSVSSMKSENKRKLRSKQDKLQEDPLENKEFVNYLEMRQDAIMDENPELSQEDIVTYLYKTWLYEQSSKSDVKKNDDLREMNLVKGLNSDVEQNRKQNNPDQTQKNNNKKKLSLQRNSMQRFLNRKKEDSKIDTVKLNESFEKVEVDINDGKVQNGGTNICEEPTSDQMETETQPEVITEAVIQNVVSELSDVTIPINPIEKEKNEKTESIDTNKQSPVNGNEILTSDSHNPEKEHIPEPKSSLSDDFDRDSVASSELLDIEAPVIKCKLRPKLQKDKEDRNKDKADKNKDIELKIKDEELDTISINSEDSELSTTKRKKRLVQKKPDNPLEDIEFAKYFEMRQDALMDENPELTHDEIVAYLYQTWQYEETTKSEIKKNDEIKESSLVKGLNEVVQHSKKYKRKTKIEKEIDDDVILKEKPKRKSIKPFYNEEYSDVEEELEVFSIFKPKVKQISKEGTDGTVLEDDIEEINDIDAIELYFEELTKPKPNVFKGLIREKVCDICENTGNLAKCKGCNGMFHVDCVSKEVVKVEIPAPSRGRKKKKKLGRRPKNLDDSDDKSQDISEDNNASIEDIIESESHTVDAETLEAQLEAKMKEILSKTENIDYDSYSSDDALDWSETVPGKCEIIDIKLKPRQSDADIDYSNFKCKNCQNYDTPICFVCKSAVSKNESKRRQKCHVAHCHKYYHLECLEQWPQTQFNGGEPSKNNKKINEHFEALTCPRHVCHTCVSDDPRGCKTRFSGDKLARCVRCPATYHSFTKCLPAGSQILTASHIICPRHYEHRPGKVPCHVNTGWCFICALGGSLICCEYCPTSFHAECLNIKPPEGGYMCEDCETGRLPLYGEMVWVKLGHYRWWPGIILHPSEIPENLMAVKHNLGEFVVRFFGQYDHYWVNRGRVFPFQEGDSGRISSQKSKIDAAFTTAMEHAQRACEILKKAQPNEEESLDIASSLLPPHYVKLKVNKPCGSLCGWKLDDPESSLTQCECNPNDDDPCGPYSQCLNRMLLTECGPTCRAADRCNNRAFEKRLYPKLVPYRTPSRGWGLKTLEDIKAGQFVIEYVGELIDEEEFRRRMRRKHEIRDENFYFLTLDKERMIDAGPKGNLARFMNHCCEPNCETQKWTVLGDVRVGLFALFDIPANSEVTFNYNLECAGIEKKRCMCGAKRCSGYIGAKPKQEESQTKKPKIPGKRTYKKRKPTDESPSTKNKPKRPIGRPPKPRELTEIEKDLLIIRNATNGLSSDESSRSMSSEYERNPKALKRKRVNFSTDDVIHDGEPPSGKKQKMEEKVEMSDCFVLLSCQQIPSR